MTYPRLGISNVLTSDTQVVYSRVPGRGSVGRIADLFAHAGLHEFKLDPTRANQMGILIHAMLDGVFLLAKGSSIYTETACGFQEALIATRFSIAELIQDDAFPMGIEVWVKDQWNRSAALADLRSLVRGTDRVEARYNMKLKLLEWRVIRRQTPEAAPDAAGELIVIEDESDRIYQGSDLPKELSELPFDKWLEEVYKSSGRNRDEGAGSGEIYFEGESLQNEAEVSRVVVNREKIAVEDTVKKEMAKNCWEDGVEHLDLKSTIDAENEQRVEQKADEILAGIEEIQDEKAKVIVRDSKRRELRAKHDLVVSQRKAEKYEILLQEKEKTIQKKASEIRYLNAKLLEKTGSGEFTEGAQRFKEKALQMADALRKVKEDNESLERMVLELRQKMRLIESSAPAAAARVAEGGPMTVAQQQVEDLHKKIDVFQRALEAEKQKVISMTDRLNTAEKEAQSAGPIIQDLENKVEHTLKTAQQHKKETEAVKQKLVQSEAEKNRIKNELVKAQAQIQTLMKRQAS